MTVVNVLGKCDVLIPPAIMAQSLMNYYLK